MTYSQNLELRHVTPPFRTFVGEKAMSALPRELARVGASRAVVVCVKPIVDHPEAMQRLRDALGSSLVGLFDGVVEHSPLPAVNEARQYLADMEADAIIAVGGGSSVVTARAASILLAERRDIRELCTRREEDGRLTSPKLSAPKLPQWVVPSTPTTAYAKAGAAIRDPETGERLALFDPKARAQGVILDPVVASTAPEKLAWSASLNIFAMAIEGLQSRSVDPLADALLLQALRTVIEWVPRLKTKPNSAQPRLNLMLASLMSGQGSDHTGGGLAQALAHAIGPRSSAPNGVVESILLPHVTRYNIEAVSTRIASIGDALGIADRSADGTVREIERLLDVFETPRRLRDISVSRDALEECADHALDDFFITTGPRPVDRTKLLELLTAAW
ncbi:iron-containing alcohol dehydrogenase [Rhodococcus sp. 06-156-3C]|uniref:iron-containing alcohol dehydrogenase family protein n=1 Tax=Nocardiaceae TaxID=85025 RepID=UPI00069068B9|nr:MULTISPECIES: iron-containing alcohol dehydrogenase family protein [Rhodococcus]OZD13106.1 iron-containing alcohol dehydrogenase [Rhodococcus sp. 06-156-4a]OZD17975.1 iron-containing alcohol dehydrogenase [Rhodococcus sp. 06-156-3C]OZD20699.1 iron-containing alcohol dehydrogenase [Rhodococcus sp. 06-156-4C]OZD30582.1 iron-containing alcohol dehydrogenase [Rhodococcus sp. 06-156-3b]OZD32645.1 iron-containing alcohol dehydrogenase [Rhodococcus sp. 06-156-3]